MCGVTGGWWRVPPKSLEQQLQRAVSAMRLRGPNDQGYELYPSSVGVVALGHTRLSIIDLSDAGHQPMHSRDQRYCIAFNGEIYNYRELRDDLKKQGYKFYTDSDTEVLLCAWQCWGQDCLPKLVGMFAFAVFDQQKGIMTCVRDPFGIKPFFYSIENSNFLFASEIMAIKALKTEKLELNWQRAYDYLVHGDYDSKTESFLKGVYHLMPGHLIELNIAVELEKLAPIRWWHPRIAENKMISFASAADELRERFLNNIRLHLRSDVPLGAALSGGVDSSAIVCAMRYVESDLPIHTFSYIADDQQISEERWIDCVNDHAHAIPHKVIVNSAELANDLDDMIKAQGEPFGGTSIYAQYRVFKAAKEHGITVTLDGQGADELLAGYQGYPGKRIKSILESGHFYDAFQFLYHWSLWPDRSFSKGLKQVVAEYVDGELYNILRSLHGNKSKVDWLALDLLRENGVTIGFPKQNAQNAPQRRLVSELAFGLTHRGLPSLLRHGDRNSMRFSVESRVPFLTPDMADFLLSLPEHYLISQQGETKSVFRAAMRGIVPDQILDRRDKVGFSTPEQAWLMCMTDQIKQWLATDIGLPFLNQEKIMQEFDSIVAGKKAFSWQVWRWINFIRWYQVIVD